MHLACRVWTDTSIKRPPAPAMTHTCGIRGPESPSLHGGVRIELYVHLIWAGGNVRGLGAAAVLAYHHGALVRAVVYLNVVVRTVLVGLQLKLFKHLRRCAGGQGKTIIDIDKTLTTRMPEELNIKVWILQWCGVKWHNRMLKNVIEIQLFYAMAKSGDKSMLNW